MREHWITTQENEKYEVSNQGRVRNKRSGRILAPQYNKPGGYLRVNINGKHHYIHRLVANAFYDGDHSNMDVNHRDGNKENNNLVNLELTTRKQNIRHAWDNGLASTPTRVVHCKVCKCRYEYDWCKDKDDTFYCAYGERR